MSQAEPERLLLAKLTPPFVCRLPLGGREGSHKDPHHLEVLSVPPTVHLHSFKQPQGLLHAVFPGAKFRRFFAATDVHVPHHQPDLTSRLRSTAGAVPNNEDRCGLYT